MLLLLERLKDRRFADWNERLKRLVFIVELAKVFGCQLTIEQLLDSDNQAAEFLIFLAGFCLSAIEQLSALYGGEKAGEFLTLLANGNFIHYSLPDNTR